ncbi:MAG: endonuclease NucS domain-containing protein, partial [Candidatus Angelobacter sp.]
MLERDIEDLVAAHPKDFFNKEFTLIGRQQSFADVGRFDLLFKDEFGWMILVELKARVAKYEDATQLAKYKDELARRNQTSVIMWLVAPHIPSSIREFLDGIGIEYTEIHEAQFRRVAQRYGKTFSRDPHPEAPNAELNGKSKPAKPPSPIVRASNVVRRAFNPTQVATGPTVSAPPSFKWRNVGFDLVVENTQDFDKNRFTELVKSFETSVPSAKNSRLVEKLIEWGSDPVNNRLSKYICFRLLR